MRLDEAIARGLGMGAEPTEGVIMQMDDDRLYACSLGLALIGAGHVADITAMDHMPTDTAIEMLGLERVGAGIYSINDGEADEDYDLPVNLEGMVHMMSRVDKIIDLYGMCTVKNGRF